MTGLTIAHFGLQRQSKQLRDELLDATDQVLQSGQFLDGPFTRQFENWLRFKTGSDYAITVHSGTQALEIIAEYIKIKHLYFGNFEPPVVLPNISYPATLNAFVSKDINIELRDTDKYGILSEKSMTVAETYCLVGLYGRSPWHDLEFTDGKNIIVDGAQHWLVADGNIGLAMSISFDPTKNLPSTGNGGAIVTNDQDFYNYAVKQRNNGKPNFDFAGSNTKMSEQDCAQILVRTKYLDSWQHRREQIRQFYVNELSNYVKCLSDDFDIPHSNQKFVIYTPEHRNSLHTHLLVSGIDSKIHYDYTLAELESASKISIKPDMLSTSFMLMRGVLSLPIYPELTDLEVEYIVNKVKEFYKHA